MSLQPWTQWPAEQPPPDFADRMAERLLQAPGPMVRPSRSPRRWLAAIALAAVLVGTTAWAMVHYARTHAPAPPAPVAEQPAAAPEPSAPSKALPGAVAPTPPPEEPAPVSALPTPRPKVSAAASTPVAPPSASVRHIVVPRCECGPASVICTCVE